MPLIKLLKRDKIMKEYITKLRYAKPRLDELGFVKTLIIKRIIQKC